MDNNRKIFLERVKNFIERTTERKDLLYIFSPCSIGDFFYNGGLSYAVQERKNKSATVFVVKERMKNLHVTYKNFANILYVSDETMTAIQNYFYMTANYEAENYIYGHFKRATNGNYVWDENLHLIDRYKKDVFAVPLNIPYAMPVVEKISRQEEEELSNRYTLDKDKTVIISPYVHSTKQLPMTFWENLVLLLKQRGYIVYTNTAGFSEKPVAGTEAVTTSFPQLYFVSDKIRCFIGSRNGVFDFLGITKAKILNINPFPDWLWDVGLLYPECNNRTFYNAVEYVKPVTEYFRKSNVAAKISLAHANIKSADIFFDYGIMLKEIVNAV